MFLNIKNNYKQVSVWNCMSSAIDQGHFIYTSTLKNHQNTYFKFFPIFINLIFCDGFDISLNRFLRWGKGTYDMQQKWYTVVKKEISIVYIMYWTIHIIYECVYISASRGVGIQTAFWLTTAYR